MHPFRFGAPAHMQPTSWSTQRMTTRRLTIRLRTIQRTAMDRTTPSRTCRLTRTNHACTPRTRRRVFHNTRTRVSTKRCVGVDPPPGAARLACPVALVGGGVYTRSCHHRALQHRHRAPPSGRCTVLFPKQPRTRTQPRTHRDTYAPMHAHAAGILLWNLGWLIISVTKGSTNQ